MAVARLSGKEQRRTTGYPYDADVILATVTPLGGLSTGRRELDRGHYCDGPLKGGTRRPQLDGSYLGHHFFSDADPLEVVWPPQCTAPVP